MGIDWIVNEDLGEIDIVDIVPSSKGSSVLDVELVVGDEALQPLLTGDVGDRDVRDGKWRIGPTFRMSA